ncbi:hypothetical protein BDP81DRAFT_320929 [Colletotrichum phormii]|uniref:Uncharacterized protein n=1 Tax=Colletotrichum phormii TaxID=359342 RepID=A0AAI9ZSU2_9PEZI|nr:uncharacterized protein BDP81DRAFT_320929 [Colletotrichum phormii]KAK1636378.1 hypothetical protein BDP81DRAFT_320929 [Colletotrichum phormii]
MIYEYSDMVPLQKRLWVNLSSIYSEAHWERVVCRVCSKTADICFCLRPTLLVTKGTIRNEVMDLLFAKNDFQFEPSCWFSLSELNDPNLRPSRLRTPPRLRELWTELISRMRRITITLRWDKAYLTAVSSALIRNAHNVTELTFFLPNGKKKRQAG